MGGQPCNAINVCFLFHRQLLDNNIKGKERKYHNYLVTGSYKTAYLYKLNTLTCFFNSQQTQQLKMIL